MNRPDVLRPVRYRPDITLGSLSVLVSLAGAAMTGIWQVATIRNGIETSLQIERVTRAEQYQKVDAQLTEISGELRWMRRMPGTREPDISPAPLPRARNKGVATYDPPSVASAASASSAALPAPSARLRD